MKTLTIKTSLQALLLVSFFSIGMTTASAEATTKKVATKSKQAKIVLLKNPAENFDISMGDLLTRTVVIKVPAPYEIAKKAFPKKNSRVEGVQLVGIQVDTEQQKTGTTYTVQLDYQPFVHHSTPAAMQLPKKVINLSGGSKPLSVTIPAWNFRFSPLATGEIKTAVKHLQADIKPPLLDAQSVKSKMIAFFGLGALALLSLLYMNADGRWLPFMGGAFARAHRQLKRLAKSNVTKTAKEEKQALVYIHEAFNQHFGANIFARDINKFVTNNGTFKKMQPEIEAFFDYSNKSLYSVEKHDSDKIINDLVVLSKQLRDCERGV